MTLRPLVSKPLGHIIDEWDALAPTRFEQITSGRDVTYNHVLIPNTLKLVAEASPRTIIDVGCGVGILTTQLVQFASTVTGIDPSAKSIAIAENFAKRTAPTVRFIHASLEEFSSVSTSKYDLAVANMVLMDVLDLRVFLAALKLLLNPGGALVFSITHPWFWPSYYGYADETWFSYNKEIVIEGPFRTSLDAGGLQISTHVHRPLGSYFRAFQEAELQVEALSEPMPDAAVSARYSTTHVWKFPRYLLGRCTHRSSA